MAAGAVNCEGRIVVRAERCGSETALADIVHAVEAAQARAAPVQRLADQVAGGFAVGVLALSTATFAFWAAAAPRLFPQACLPCICSSCLPRAQKLAVAVLSASLFCMWQGTVNPGLSAAISAGGKGLLCLGSCQCFGTGAGRAVQLDDG